MNINCFCASCQKETVHSVAVNTRRNDELVLGCPCGREIKAPKGTPEELQAWLKAHKDGNVGQVPLDMDVVNAANEAYLQTLKTSGLAS